MPSSRSTVAALSAAFVLSVLPGLSHAQCSGKPLFEDTFRSLDPAWGRADAVVGVDQGALVMKVSPGQERILLSQSDFYGDGSLCVDTQVSEAPSTAGTAIGVAFWATGAPNYYAMLVSADAKGGIVLVARVLNQRGVTPVQPTYHSAIRSKVGDSNAIEVRLQGPQATIFVNGQQLTQFRGTPPTDGGLIGVVAVSPKGAAPAVLKFRNFRFFGPSAGGPAAAPGPATKPEPGPSGPVFRPGPRP